VAVYPSGVELCGAKFLEEMVKVVVEEEEVCCPR
jgi:hypothetical protein